MTYRKTLHACYRGYVVQAIINNLAPVLFTTFVFRYGIAIEKIALLIFVNFAVQMAADVFSIYFIERVGLRRAALFSHVCAAAGLWLMAILPLALPSPFVGLVLATVVCAWGGGLLEVLVSPIVDLLPGDAKAASMSLLHSFYCWGQLAVVLLSTLVLRVVGAGRWPLLPLLWSLLPLLNFASFWCAPMPQPPAAEKHKPTGALLRSGWFWLAMLLMVAAGASEQGMAQWSSAFAEAGLGVDKTLGDVLGPCLFAAFMGLGRTLYGLFGARIPLLPTLAGLAALGVASYLTAALAPMPALALAGCALCGFAVSLFWPGVFSLCAASLRGGTAMFGALAIMGDIGCAVGPWLVGMVAGGAGGAQNLSSGLLAGTVFPAVMLLGALVLLAARRHAKRAGPS